MTNSLSNPNLYSRSPAGGSVLLPWIVCLSAALFFFYEFIQLHMFNSIEIDIVKEFNVNATVMGRLSSLYFISNVLFLFPAGIILDRFSTRKVIITSLAICVVGVLFLSKSTTLWFAMGSRFLTGIGSAFCFLSSIRLATRWFPPQRMALVAGLIVTIGMAGGYVAQAPITWLTQQYGWRQTLIYDVYLGVAILLIIAFTVRNYPRGTEPQRAVKIPFWPAARSSYLSLQNWLGGIYTSFMNLPIFLLGALWGIPYLVQVHGFERYAASEITGMLFIGTIMGSPLAGFISDALGKRKLPMLVGTVISLIILLAIMFFPSTVEEGKLAMLMSLFFLLGLFTSTQVISYPAITESNPPQYAAMSVSVISICCIAGGGIFQPLFGWIMDLGKQPAASSHPVYAASDYVNGMWLIVAAFIISFIAALLLRETYSRLKSVD